LVLFLRKNHTFRHPSGGSDIGRWKYGSTPHPDLTKMSTPPKAATSSPEPYYSRM
jgi:hypothetical protein